VPYSSDPSDRGLWLASQRRSRARRSAASRSRRRSRWLRSGAGVLAASLTFAAGGALAAGSTGGASATSSSASTRGVSVKAIQRALGVPADGVIGPRTRRAIKRFQRTHGLKADGIVGPATLAALGLSAHTAKTTLAAVGDATAELAKIAACESGGNPAAVSADGQYRGKYQFTRATWAALGGTGDPARTPEATQDAMAAKLLAQRGTAPWPACA
jgi:peptidoglycan hydrolase-like protein with peptidoglycan-binding domain